MYPFLVTFKNLRNKKNLTKIIYAVNYGQARNLFWYRIPNLVRSWFELISVKLDINLDEKNKEWIKNKKPKIPLNIS